MWIDLSCNSVCNSVLVFPGQDHNRLTVPTPDNLREMRQATSMFRSTYRNLGLKQGMVCEMRCRVTGSLGHVSLTKQQSIWEQSERMQARLFVNLQRKFGQGQTTSGQYHVLNPKKKAIQGFSYPSPVWILHRAYWDDCMNGRRNWKVKKTCMKFCALRPNTFSFAFLEK